MGNITPEKLSERHIDTILDNMRKVSRKEQLDAKVTKVLDRMRSKGVENPENYYRSVLWLGLIRITGSVMNGDGSIGTYHTTHFFEQLYNYFERKKELTELEDSLKSLAISMRWQNYWPVLTLEVWNACVMYLLECSPKERDCLTNGHSAESLMVMRIRQWLMDEGKEEEGMETIVRCSTLELGSMIVLGGVSAPIFSHALKKGYYKVCQAIAERGPIPSAGDLIRYYTSVDDCLPSLGVYSAVFSSLARVYCSMMGKAQFWLGHVALEIANNVILPEEFEILCITLFEDDSLSWKEDDAFSLQSLFVKGWASDKPVKPVWMYAARRLCDQGKIFRSVSAVNLLLWTTTYANDEEAIEYIVRVATVPQQFWPHIDAELWSPEEILEKELDLLERVSQYDCLSPSEVFEKMLDVSMKQQHMFKWILKMKPDPNDVSQKLWETDETCCELWNLAVDYGIDVNHALPSGENLLWRAIRHYGCQHCYKLVEKLLDCEYFTGFETRIWGYSVLPLLQSPELWQPLVAKIYPQFPHLLDPAIYDYKTAGKCELSCILCEDSELYNFMTWERHLTWKHYNDNSSHPLVKYHHFDVCWEILAGYLFHFKSFLNFFSTCTSLNNWLKHKPHLLRANRALYGYGPKEACCVICGLNFDIKSNTEVSCEFHHGTFNLNSFSCCSGTTYSPGCIKRQHVKKTYYDMRKRDREFEKTKDLWEGRKLRENLALNGWNAFSHVRVLAKVMSLITDYLPDGEFIKGPFYGEEPVSWFEGF